MLYIDPLFMLQNPTALERFLQKLYDEQDNGRVKALKSIGVMISNCVSASIMIATTHPNYFAQLQTMVDIMNRSQKHNGTELTSNTVKMHATLSTIFVTGVKERAIKTNLGQTTHQPLWRGGKHVGLGYFATAKEAALWTRGWSIILFFGTSPGTHIFLCGPGGTVYQGVPCTHHA